MSEPGKPPPVPPDQVSPSPAPQQTGKPGKKLAEIDGNIDGDRRSRFHDGVAISTYNHQQQQEIARRNIAYVLICLVTALVLMSFIYLWTLPLNENARKHVDNLMLLMQLVFGPIITLAATAIGYYFGTNSRTGGL